MNDLDDLIRASLHEHTPTTTPDDALAGRVQARGRRVRRTRTAGLAAVSIAAVIAVIWGASVLPGRSRPDIAASPGPVPSVSVQSTPTPTASFSPGGKVRDVTKIGAPGEGEAGEFLNNYFASPSGNFQCFINTTGAGCVGGTWAPGVLPSRKICSEGSPSGPEMWGSKPAAWHCSTDPHSFPYLDRGYEEGVAWWDDTFGTSMRDPWTHTQKLAVLPYGKGLVAGDFRCTMAKTGVTCVNTRTGEGFTASRAKVDLTP
ncbi:MAG: hypothetical protein LCH96_12585 [Actinobacteria bacterium]|nr:hypothetical protein [Actinomycetota bacterium]